MIYDTKLVILDFESTGLDPEKHRILEVACQVVCANSGNVIDSFQTLVGPPPTPGEMHPVVWKLHYGSGLLDAFAKAIEDKGDSMLSLNDAETAMVAFLDRTLGGTFRRPPLVGANPDFDRRFAQKHMPDLAREFDYRSIDSNSFWLLEHLTQDDTPEKEASAHRALSDCEAVRLQLAEYARIIRAGRGALANR